MNYLFNFEFFNNYYSNLLYNMKFHVLINPAIPPSKENILDAYTSFLFQWCDLFVRKNHQVIVYGYKEVPLADRPSCTSYVDCISLKDWEEVTVPPMIPNFNDTSLVQHNIQSMVESENQIRIRYKINVHTILNNISDKSPQWIIHFYDYYLLELLRTTLPSSWIHVIPMHMGSSLTMKTDIPTIFCSQFWLTEYTTTIQKSPLKKSKIIHPWFNPKEFTPLPKHDPPVYLYLARCTPLKGIYFFLQISQLHPSKTFWVAGSVDKTISIDWSLYPNVKFWGFANRELRNYLLGSATCLIQPTIYYEPFGFNAVEAMLSGTPVIAPNKGAFRETIKPNVSGLLYDVDEHDNSTCSNISEAMKNIHTLSTIECRQYALNKFTDTEDRYKRYMKFFNKKLSPKKEWNDTPWLHKEIQVQ